MSGFLCVFPPEVGLQIAMANLAAVRERVLTLGVATEQQVDEVMGGLSAALKAKDSYDWISSPLIFDLAFQLSSPTKRIR